MRISLLLLAALLATVRGATFSNSLCISCSVQFSNMCLTCNANGCSPYSKLDSTTGQCVCNAGYFLNNANSNALYCGRCFIGCSSCTGPQANSCLTCADSFTFDSATSSCLPPSSASDFTLQQAYYFLGFNANSNWSPQGVTACSATTLLGYTNGTYNIKFTNLKPHFALRVMFAHFLPVSAGGSANTSIVVGYDGANQNNIPILTNLNGSNTPVYNCGSATTFLETYVDYSFSHTVTATTNITISTSGLSFGLREVFIIVKLCNGACTSCNGYYTSSCTGCADTNRLSNVVTPTTNFTGMCMCVGNYYEEPVAGACVQMCPALPNETFGDNNTRKCVTNCPSNTYAYTDLYRCWADCPTTSVVSGSLLFKDSLNWRCVPNCPPQAPYACKDAAYRACYAICPNTTNTVGQTVDYFAVDGHFPECVSVCPYNSSYWTFGYQGNCIPRCPTGTWGDPYSKLCIPNCNYSGFIYKDNSSGINICNFNCSNLNYFRDNTTFTCVLTCPGNLFGETTRECVTRCADGSFGLPFGNRKCVSFCPQGWWGEPDNNVCVNTTQQCKTTTKNGTTGYYRYADNYTRTCVFPYQCSFGYYGDNSTQNCVPQCPTSPTPVNTTNSSVAYINSVCQVTCQSPYFADYVAGLCVLNCITNNTYSDVSSGRTCVTACNTAGLTPWADNNTWTCVNNCNGTGISNFVSDNSTFSCVYYCPTNSYADRITTNNPTCRLVCLNTTYADNSTGTGLCSWGCSTYPPRFGDPTNYTNLCVPICTPPLFGDTTGLRLCVPVCPSGYYSQNDTTRQCVTRCNPGSYGSNFSCLLNPLDCPAGQFANDATNLCDYCSAALGTWGDPVSKRCVTVCPLNPAQNSSAPAASPITHYADVTVQQCVLTCNSTYSVSPFTGMFGNNNTRSCVFKCTDLNSYAKIPAAGGFRVCVARCYPFNYFANNETRICVTSINCPVNQFGENSTQSCLSTCPTGSWAYATTFDRLCIDICPLTWYADNTTGLNICVENCPAIPSMFADSTTKNCVAQCPISGGVTYYAETINRTCVANCPLPYYAYTPNRTCLLVCPSGYFGLNSTVANVTFGTCVKPSSSCGSLIGDPYLNLCVSLCTGPTPVSLYAYGSDCVAVCPPNYYANTYNGVRECVQLCPPGVIDSLATPNFYGDNQTKSCVARCVTPLTWADPHTRLCQSVCSASASPPLYSENFGFTCVSALNCPTSPSMTFGDNATRSCLSNCTLGTFGDPESRSCLTQCQNVTATGTSTYYSDKSTGQYLCVTICPILPALFGLNSTNTCVQQCPAPLYGDQTANRTCLAVCPIVSGLVYFAQNLSRICVTVCNTGTWGNTAYQECVENPFHCNTQWADNTTNLCVTTCPASVDTYADPTTGFCVPLCPNSPNKYFSDISTRTCVQRCPDSVDFDGTFGNNETRVCQDYCSAFNNNTILTYADPQTLNRYCVLQCSQSPNETFADPSSRTCVPICPTTPSLFGERTTFTCVATCANGTYANTDTRLCTPNCTGKFNLTNPNECVSICPADQAVPLYGDPFTGNCVGSCSNNYFRYKTTSMCVSSCLTYNLSSFNMTCITYCPQGYYANALGVCVVPSSCPSTTFGENSTTTCLGTCLTGFAHINLCIAVCPNGYFGQNFMCVTSCQVAGNSASALTNTCISNCTNGTYAQNGTCSPNCTSGSYADPLTNNCSTSCSGAAYYGSPVTNACVLQCPPAYYMNNGYCTTGCTGNYFADNVTWSCTLTCATGYWGYNNLCLSICPSGYFGYLSNRICYSISTFPASNAWFANNITQTWESVCPINPLTFGDITLRYCISSCLGTTLADPSTRQCETSCKNTRYFADFVNNKCVLVCPPGYFANINNNRCESICTSGYAYSLDLTCVGTCPAPYSGYNNGTARLCVLRCPTNYYSFNQVCGTGCTSPYYADNSTNQCVLSCINSFASDDVRVCVPGCAIYSQFNISDNSNNTCVSICPSDPDYYAQDHVCVFNCSNGTFADPAPGVRICTTLCTTGLFSNPLSGRCEAACPKGYWAQNQTNKCESVCSIGFADNSTGLCVPECPTPTFADKTTARCVKVCPSGYFGEVNNTCVNKCTLPNYANPLTRNCGPSCPAFNYTFAQNTTASCVRDCSIVSNSYADRSINVCVSNCTLSNEYMLDGLGICTSLCPEGLFMENSTQRCQEQCTTGYAEPTTRYCVAQCFGDPQTFGHDGICLYQCLDSINLYADNSTNLCVSPCPSTPNYFADPLSGNCVSWCPDGYFSQTSGRTCTQYCTVGFADNLTRSCVDLCPTETEQTYADPNTRTCVRICPNDYYAENSTQSCVHICSNNTWSDKVSKYCVARCPSQPLAYGWNDTTTCVQRCPTTLFGDFESQTCLSSCPTALNGEYQFADPVSQTCVYVCPMNSSLYGDIHNFTCVSTCSGTQSRDNSTQRCVSVCPSQPSYWSNPLNKKCVYHCPPSYFASNRPDRVCVLSCQTYLTFGDRNSRICTNLCPENYWADNSTYLCVDVCPISPDLFADNVSRSCVYNCPKDSNTSATYITFADRTTRRCVTQCPEGYFAINSTQRCNQTCPQGEYADPIIRVCVQNCTVRPHYYKTSAGTCVFQCPITPVVAYKLNTDHTCVYTNPTNDYTGCPSTYWADPTNNTCTQVCPDTYFADQVKHLCVQNCPIGTFADQTDRLCKGSCSSIPEQYRLSLTTGLCVQFCPYPYFADNSTYNCVVRCPNVTSPAAITYSYQITRKCLQKCPPPYYSYLPDNTCITDCPPGYFAQDSTRSCETTCLSPYFADDSTNKCVLTCPEIPLYYGLNQVCRSSCPASTYADNSTRLCVTNCPTQPQTFADNSTHKCVFNCPSSPNYYANNLTMVCVFHCPPGLFADANTRTCAIECPSDLMTYADPTTKVCQPACPSPYFASDLTKQCVPLCPNTPVKTYARIEGRVCVTACPSGTYAENISRTCALDCTLVGTNKTNNYSNPSAFADRTNNMCASTCPYGWFGDNSTLSCVLNCPQGSFADSNTRRCLTQCPGTERLFADSTTMRCVSQCPDSTFGNNQNWTCIDNCPPTVFGYKLDLAHLCIEYCPSPFFAFNATRTCKGDCGGGFFGDPVTRICTACPDTCPTCTALTQCLTCNTGMFLAFGSCFSTCPNGIYANNASMSCVYAVSCPSGTYGNNDTSSCSATCPNKQYADALTKMCQLCPYTCASCTSTAVCLTCIPTALFSNVTKQCYAFCSPTEIYNYNGTCYLNCPNTTYLDYTNINCQACNSICATCSLTATNCTSCASTYLFNLSCISQCPSGYYGANNTCLVCTSDVKSCNNPLTFAVSTKTENYQTVLYMKFNQQTKIEGDPSSFLSLNLKPGRLLQAGAVNGGVQFTTQVMSDGTIKIILAPGLTLTNPSFTVSINNPSKIKTASGDTLQSLQSSIDNVAIKNYPAGATADAPLVIAGTILSIFMLVLLGLIFLCTPLPVFLTLEAFQMISFYALVVELPPNLFYFMKKLSLTRLGFLPNIFQSVYTPPSGYFAEIPTRVTDLDGALSFSLTSGSYFFALLIYGLVALIIYGLSTKHNNNRPLRELFTKIFEMRVKWGLLNDFLWMFSLNIFVCGFMQFRFTQNGGDVALAVISLLLFFGVLIAHFVHHYKKFDAENQEMVSNYHFTHEGLSDGPRYKYTTFIYYLRKIIFALLIAGTISLSAKAQCITLIMLSSFMLVFLVVLRPYQDKLRNLIHILHEIGLTFLGGAMLYYQHYLEIKEPIGTQIICGTIITCVIISHLSIAFIWGVFKSYTFYKQLYGDFKKTEFYHLYLDKKFDDSIEKELQELNDESGEVQSVELTNVAEGENNEEENVIRLKIKRRRKVNKGAVPEREREQPKVSRHQGEYIKLNHTLEEETPIFIEKSSEHFERMNFEEAFKPTPIEKSQDNAWNQILDSNPSERPQSRQSAFEPIIDHEILSSSNNNDFQKISGRHILDRSKSALEMQEISSVSNKEEKASKEEGDEHLRESLRQMNQADYEDAIYQQDIFQMEDDEEPIEQAVINKKPEQQIAEPEAQIYVPQPGIVEPELIVVSQTVAIEKQELQVPPLEVQASVDSFAQQAQRIQAESQKAVEPYQKMQSNANPSNLFNFEQEPSHHEEQSVKNDEWEELPNIHKQKKQERVNNFFDIDIDFEEPENKKESEESRKQEESVKLERQQQKEAKNAPPEKASWSMDLESLLNEEEKQKNKSKHMLLFDEQDFE